VDDQIHHLGEEFRMNSIGFAIFVKQGTSAFGKGVDSVVNNEQRTTTKRRG
jgi:hypothetical protein